ncbi:hypothetical protein JCM5350_007789 [Sporobolomyces pararoseus]
MFNMTSSIRAALRVSPSKYVDVIDFISLPLLICSLRSLHSSRISFAPNDSPPPTASGTSKSASDPKEGGQQRQPSEQEMKQTEEAMGGAEMAYGQYGGAKMQEGNFTDGSKEGKERKEAAKQGEK